MEETGNKGSQPAMYKNRLKRLILFLSIITGVISAAILSLNLFIDQTDSKDPKDPKAPKGFVVFATRDVPKGRTLTKDDVYQRLVDEDRIAEDSFSSVDDVKGEIAIENIQSGQIISSHDVSPAHSKP